MILTSVVGFLCGNELDNVMLETLAHNIKISLASLYLYALKYKLISTHASSESCV